MRVRFKSLLPFLVLLYSCAGTTSEKVYDPLAMFPMNDQWEFISSKDNNRIAVLIKRTDDTKFTYRIELLRNWFGLPLDNGILTFKKMDSDSTFTFSGGNVECKVFLKMYQSTEKGGGKRLVLERTCIDSTKNIATSDFPPLWRKGESHSRPI